MCVDPYSLLKNFIIKLRKEIWATSKERKHEFHFPEHIQECNRGVKCASAPTCRALYSEGKQSALGSLWRETYTFPRWDTFIRRQRLLITSRKLWFSKFVLMAYTQLCKNERKVSKDLPPTVSLYFATILKFHSSYLVYVMSLREAKPLTAQGKWYIPLDPTRHGKQRRLLL